MGEDSRRSVAVIIPAKDEAARISNVLAAACGSKLATEVIVVCDGCVDRTADVAGRFRGVNVLELPINMGKGGAMSAGVAATKADILAFVDADLVGLRPEHIDAIIKPLLANQCEMCIGVFRGGKFWSDTAQRFAPYISGQRAMKRSLFLAVPNITDQGMGVEVAINTQAKRTKARVLRVVLRGVSNSFKERKLGFGKGVKERFKMYSEITQTMVKSRKRRKPPRGKFW